MLSNHLILCCLLFLLPSIFSSIRVFSNESAIHPGGQSIGASASASVLPEYSALISFRIDWLDLLAVQRTLKSLLQHHNAKTSIVQHSAFFMVQLSHRYMTTGKTRALTRQTFVSQAMSLFSSMLSRFVRAFLPRSKCLLTSCLWSPFTVILEPKKIKSVTVCIFSHLFAMN